MNDRFSDLVTAVLFLAACAWLAAALFSGAGSAVPIF